MGLMVCCELCWAKELTILWANRGTNTTYMMDVAFSHITFVGKGKNQTTIRGGFKVCNQQNVRFEELAVMNSWDTNPNSCRPMGYVEHRMGFDVRGNETNVMIFKCAVKHCIGPATHVLEATVAATQCGFTENQLIKHNNNSGRLPNSPQCCPCPPPTQHIAQQQRWWDRIQGSSGSIVNLEPTIAVDSEE